MYHLQFDRIPCTGHQSSHGKSRVEFESVVTVLEQPRPCGDFDPIKINNLFTV